jgi:hypothetical protein
VFIIAQFIFHVKRDHQKACNANGESQNVNEGVEFVLQDAPEGYIEKVFKHSVLI